MPVTFVGAGTPGAASGPNGIASATIPAGVQPGDVLVFLAGTSRGSTSGSAAFSFSGLWNSFQTRFVDNGSTAVAMNYGARIFADGDPTSYDIQLAGGEAANTAVSCFILAFRGADLASLTVVGGVSGNGGSSSAVFSTSVPIPACNFTDNHSGAMAIAFVTGHGTAGPWGTPTGWTSAAHTETALGPIGNSLSAFVRSFAAGVTASDAPNVTAAQTTAGGFQLAINSARPAESGTGVRVRASSMQGVWASGADIRVPKPVGTQTGDLMFMTVGSDQGVAPEVAVPEGTFPAGWTRFFSYAIGGAGYLRLYWKYAAANEPGTYTIPKATNVDVTVGIVSLMNAGPPRRWNWTDGNSSSPVMPDVNVEVPGSMMLGTVLAGAAAYVNRGFLPPAGMIEQVDDRPPINGGWQAIGVFSEHRAAVGLTGTRPAQLQSMVNPTPTTGTAWNALSSVWGSVSVVIPPKGYGWIDGTGNGTLTLTPASVGPRQSLALTGSGTAIFSAQQIGLRGSLARTGSGSLGLAGRVLVGAGIALSGTGTLALAQSRITVNRTLALTGLGTLLTTGGGGAGVLAVTASGQLTFGTTLPALRGTLSLTGTGQLAFPTRAIAVRGTLARTGSGNLARSQTFMTARGSIAGYGAGQLNTGFLGMVHGLRGWDQALGQWRDVIVHGWDTLAGAWRLVAGRRLSVARQLVLAAGPIYTSPPAGVWALDDNYLGPTGLPISRITRTSDPLGWGAYTSAALPAGPVIPAGTRIRITWWARSSVLRPATGFDLINDSATASTRVISGRRDVGTGWALYSLDGVAAADWTPGVQKFRSTAPDGAGDWLEMSDVKVRIWS